jgi:hypothetical protein
MPSKKSKANQQLGRSIRSIREQKRYKPGTIRTTRGL